MSAADTVAAPVFDRYMAGKSRRRQNNWMLLTAIGLVLAWCVALPTPVRNRIAAAILAAAREGNDADKLDDKERDRLRKQALDWLRADLERRASQIKSGQPDQVATARRSLLHWQNDTDLASIRDPAPLAKLSSTERTAFAELWSTVASLLEQTK